MLYNKRIVVEISKADEVIMTIDGNMLSCEFGALDRGNITDVADWGIYANRGSVSFIDNIGYFKDEKIISSGIKDFKCVFYLTKESKNKVATFQIEDANFDDVTKQVELQLIGNIINLQRIKPNAIAYPFSQKTALYLMGLDENIPPSEAASYPWYYPSFGLKLGEDTKSLENTIIYCPYLEKENAWSRATKICQATMCRVFENENGEGIIAGSHPYRNAIIINPKNIISVSKPSIVKVQNTSIDATERKKYSSAKVSQISKRFEINYNLFGNPTSISNCNFSIEENNAEISCLIETNYKIYSCPSSSVVKTIERKDTTTGNIIGTYSTNEFSSGFSVDGIEKNDLLVEYEVSNIVRKDDANGTEDRIKSIDITFYLTYFEDVGTTTETNIVDEENFDPPQSIPSNDLIQTNSFYVEDAIETPLATHILQEVQRRYENGIDCFEIECLFNDYYYEDGSLAFSGSDLSTHFQKYDVIIPYVMKNGKSVPLRTNQDGTPKKFRIIGISYSYDGLLRQKLSVQEERYDVD